MERGETAEEYGKSGGCLTSRHQSSPVRIILDSITQHAPNSIHEEIAAAPPHRGDGMLADLPGGIRFHPPDSRRPSVRPCRVSTSARGYHQTGCLSWSAGSSRVRPANHGPA